MQRNNNLNNDVIYNGHHRFEMFLPRIQTFTNGFVGLIIDKNTCGDFSYDYGPLVNYNCSTPLGWFTNTKPTFAFSPRVVLGYSMVPSRISTRTRRSKTICTETIASKTDIVWLTTFLVIVTDVLTCPFSLLVIYYKEPRFDWSRINWFDPVLPFTLILEITRFHKN